MNKPIYDSWDRDYKSIFGALPVGTECDFSVRIPKDMQLSETPMMVVYRAGFKERFLLMSETRDEGDCLVYTTAFIPKHTGVHYYYFVVMKNGEREHKKMFIKKVDCHRADFCDGGTYQLTVYEREFNSPDWVKGGVMYQIFPDRFATSGKKHENVPTDRRLRTDWGGTPAYKPDPASGMWNNDYFGGDLDGIAEKLPYLEELGVTCIYLNPIFEAHENHRYNTANYMKIDPLLGTNEDFQRLCAKAKDCGISVILDGVFSHTGADSIYFNKNKRYDTVGAYNSQDSEYYPWYFFHEHPDKYDAWWGIEFLPNVRETNEKYLDFICGDDGVLRYWLKQGAHGWRLDVADELPNKFLDELHISVKSQGTDNLIIGEVWEDASNKESYGVKRRYLIGSQLDSVMNYPFRSAILNYLRGGSGYNFIFNIMTILENYPKPAIDVLMNSVSTHDTERCISHLSGVAFEDKDKEWMNSNPLTTEQYTRGKNLFRCASALQFFMPGVPCIYYGDEAGMQGYKDPFNRACYPWGKADEELFGYIKGLAEIRNTQKVFAEGRIDFIDADGDLLVFERTIDDESVIALVNRSGREESFELKKLLEFRPYKDLKTLEGKIDNNENVLIAPYSYTAISAKV
jgi:4-alpha-glucanotransferase